MVEGKWRQPYLNSNKKKSILFPSMAFWNYSTFVLVTALRVVAHILNVSQVTLYHFTYSITALH